MVEEESWKGKTGDGLPWKLITRILHDDHCCFCEGTVKIGNDHHHFIILATQLIAGTVQTYHTPIDAVWRCQPPQKYLVGTSLSQTTQTPEKH